MPHTRILATHLTDDAISAKGKFAVVELLDEHHQRECTPVPKGTRGILTGGNMASGGYVFLFPHSVLREPVKSFRDGDIRILKDATKYKIIGRIDLDRRCNAR